MYKLRTLYLIILFCISSLIYPQRLEFERFTTKNGLLSDEVYNLHQDQKGYLWLFTNYGAMKYNGKSFEPVLKNLPFKESFIYAFYENKNGQKWAANSNAKIYEIRNDSAFIVQGTEIVTQSLRESVSEIKQIYVDDSLNIYVCTKGYSYKFIKSQKNKAQILSHKIELDSVLFKAIEIKGEVLSVLNYQGRPIWEPFLSNPMLKIKYTNQKNENIIFSIKCNVSYGPKKFKRFGDKVYFSTYYQIWYFDEQNVVSNISLKSFILNFTKDKNNHLWVACLGDGLYEFDEHNKIVNHYFENITINDVLFDSQNGLWVSTDGFGLFHCKGLNEFHFDEKDFLGKPISFIKKIDDKLFVSTINGGIFIISKKSTKKIYNDQNRYLEQPMDILKVNGKYIISTRNKIDFYTADEKISKIKLGKKIDLSYAFKLISIGRDSIMSLQRKGYCLLYKEKLADTVVFKYKTHFCELRNKIPLFGTDNGVYQYVHDKFIQPDYLKLTENCVITKIRKDEFNNYWFCSKGDGLFKLTSKNEIKHYTTINELPSNIINDISFISSDGILLSTNKGLFYNNEKITNGKWNKIFSENVNSTTFFNDKLYLETKNGLVIINKDALQQKLSLYFNLVSILVNNRLVSGKSISYLNHLENNLEFNFDVILFSSSAPDINYSLTGTQNYSGSTKNQQISFQNLLPGKYKLLAYVDRKVNGVKFIEISFEIIPAFWQRAWFKIVSSLIVLLVVIYIVWLYFRYRKNKEDKKNSINRLITEYKLVALKAQINPHFMSNCLTAIQHLIISNKVDEANQYLAKFSLLVRQVLNFSSKPLVSLQEEIEITELNIELEQLRFDNKFMFEIELEDKHNLKSIFIPPLILQPIVENAIWHGLLPLKNRKGKLHLKINIKDDLLYIIIEDNGVGRKKNTDNIGNLKESKGISITKQRIDNINSFYNINKAGLKHDDLVDIHQIAAGTRVSIILPLNLNSEVE